MSDFSHPRSQHQKQRCQEQAVSGVGGNPEDEFIDRLQHGHFLDQPIVAVAQKAKDIEHGGHNRHVPQGQKTTHQVYHQNTQDTGREIPQMIKGPVKEKHAQGLAYGKVFIMPGINADGQI